MSGDEKISQVASRERLLPSLPLKSPLFLPRFLPQTPNKNKNVLGVLPRPSNFAGKKIFWIHICCPSASSVIFSVSSRIPSRSDINFRDCSLLVSVAAVTCDNSNLSWTYSPSEADDVAAASDDVGGMIRFEVSEVRIRTEP